MKAYLRSLAARFLRRSQTGNDLDEELRSHIGHRVADLERSGLDRNEAERRARIEFGSQECYKEECREALGGNFLDVLIHDFRFGVRMLRKSPGFTIVAVLTIALGIVASTAIFSAVNPILFASLPYPQADRLVVIEELAGNGARNAGTFGMYRGLVDRNHSFDSMSVFKGWRPTMTGATEPERLEAQRVTASYFKVLGVSPMLGRDFQQTDDQSNGPNVVTISSGLWQRRFGGDRTIIGRQVLLDDTPYTVIGVMPMRFENVLSPSAEVWAPLQYDLSSGSAWGHHLRTVGRLKSGVSVEQATREIDALGHGVLLEQHPVTYGSDVRFAAASLQDEITRSVKPGLIAVLAAAGLLLLIACVNVINLLLARGAQRRGEFAVRTALGAGRARLIQQIVTEGLLLAVLGGAVGIALAPLSIEALKALSPALPRSEAIRLDGTVFTFALAITTLIALVVGLIPALHTARDGLWDDLKQSSRRAATGHPVLRRALVVAQLALAVVLLLGAGLLLRSLQHLFAISPGFNAAHLLTMQVSTSGRRFDKKTNDRFFAQVLEETRRLPGVAGSGFTSQLPLSGDDDEYGAQFEGDEPTTAYNAFRYAVSPGYFETIGIPLRRGRLLDARDVADAPPAVVLSESLAKRKFPDQDPIGKRVHVGPPNLPWFTIVGVVGDVKQASLAVSQTDAVYTTPTQWPFLDNTMSLVVRAHGDAAGLAPSLRETIRSVDKDQPIVRVATMESLLAATAAERRFALVLFEAFGVMALALAAIGIYGVLSGSVTERTHEIGIRLALGAHKGDVVRLVLHQALRFATVGTALGVAGGLMVSHFIAGLLYGVRPTDPLTFAGVAFILIAVALLASYVPARRALKIDPIVALRSD
jgi:putative ABC transport system permease protein